MKRVGMVLVAVVLVVTMLMAMTGCDGDKKKLLGKWQATVDVTEELNEVLDDGMMEIELETTALVWEITFDEDGTYEMSVPKSSIEAMTANMKKALVPAMTTLYEELAAEFEMTVDEMLEMDGATIEEMVDELLDEVLDDAMIEEITAPYCAEGQYRVIGDGENRLHMSDDKDDEIDEDEYEVYKFEGDKMIWTENVGDDDAKDMPYPITFEKVK